MLTTAAIFAFLSRPSGRSLQTRLRISPVILATLSLNIYKTAVAQFIKLLRSDLTLIFPVRELKLSYLSDVYS